MILSALLGFLQWAFLIPIVLLIAYDGVVWHLCKELLGLGVEKVRKLINGFHEEVILVDEALLREAFDEADSCVKGMVYQINLSGDKKLFVKVENKSCTNEKITPIAPYEMTAALLKKNRVICTQHKALTQRQFDEEWVFRNKRKSYKLVVGGEMC